MGATEGASAAAVAVTDPAIATGEPKKEGDSKGRRYTAAWAYLRSWAWVRPIVILAVLYLCALSIILVLFYQLPSLSQLAEKQQQRGDGGVGAEQLRLAVPHSFDELRSVRHTLELYRRNYAVHVAALLVAVHMFLQAFMIPGSILINVLAGSMYSLPAATAFAATVDGGGASINYWLSRWLLRDVVAGLFPERVQAFAAEMKKHQANLLNYNLFIRSAPIFPSWVVNLASPIVGVPFPIFLTALLAGHLPINFISVKAGHNLGTMQSMSDLYSTRNMVVLLAVATLALLPVLLRRLRRADRTARQRHVVSLLPIIAVGGAGGGAAAALGGTGKRVGGTLLSLAPGAAKAAKHHDLQHRQ